MGRLLAEAQAERQRGVIGRLPRDFEDHALALDLADAIERGELRLACRSQVDSRDLGLHGFEALLRWHRPVHGDVDPAEFVAIAESARLMSRIGEWVLDEACRQARRWPAAIGLSVDVSAMQLLDHGFVERVARAAAGPRPGRLGPEVTEATLVVDTEVAAVVLSALRAQGHRTALDNFGTGHPALVCLRRARSTRWRSTAASSLTSGAKATRR